MLLPTPIPGITTLEEKGRVPYLMCMDGSVISDVPVSFVIIMGAQSDLCQVQLRV